GPRSPSIPARAACLLPWRERAERASLSALADQPAHVLEQDLPHGLLREAGLANVPERLVVSLPGQEKGVVAAGHDPVVAEGLDGRPERGLRSPANRVIEEALGDSTRHLRLEGARHLTVEPVKEHGQHAPEMW